MARAAVRLGGVCLDCADAVALAALWCRLLGWVEIARDGEQQKQLHLELGVDDLESAVALAVSCGAAEAPHQPPDRDPASLRVVLDPAGHPFCLAT